MKPPALDLLWVDPRALPRIRKLSDYGAPDSAESGVDEARIVNVLSKGAPLGALAVASAISSGTRPDGRFLAPLALLEGELRPVVDPVESLKVTVTAVQPFVTGDEELQSALKTAKVFLGSPGGMMPASVAESLAQRIRETFGRVRRAVSADYVERDVSRTLVEQRRLKIQVYAGGPHARALFASVGERTPHLCFVPEPAVASLPLSARIGCRILAAATPVAEAHEAHPFALRVVAIARTIPRA